MAFRAAAAGATAQPSSCGLWRLLSSRSAYPPSATAAAFARQEVEPKSSLFVSGLNKRTTSERLLQEFSKFGKVVRTRVMIDRTGCSKGYGFVQYATIEEAAKGIENMNGKFLDGWVIFVEYAKSIPEPRQQSLRHFRQ